MSQRRTQSDIPNYGKALLPAEIELQLQLPLVAQLQYGDRPGFCGNSHTIYEEQVLNVHCLR